jgi:hypothetical protein
MYVVDADAATPVRTMPAMTTPSTEPAMVTRRAAALIVALHQVMKPTGR